jgi:chromosomal replication initiation ATPase DnaA
MASRRASQTYKRMRSSYLREYTFEKLIFGSENEAAIQQLRNLANVSQAPAVPIYIHATCGNGTTAVGNALINAIPGKSAYWMDAVDFANTVYQRRQANIRPLEIELLDYKVLFFDNPCFLIGHELYEAAFAEVITKALDRGHWVILGDSMPPQELAEHSSKLSSIVRAATAVELKAPSIQARRRFLAALLQAHGEELPEAEANEIIENCLTYRELEGRVLYTVALKRLKEGR